MSPRKPALLTQSKELELKNEVQRSGGLFAVIFGYQQSKNYKLAVEFAMQASKYQRLDDGKEKKKELHAVAFSRTKEQAGLALSLLKLVGRWKNAYVYTPSAIAADTYRVQLVLECYFKSLSLADHRAHCHWVHKDYSDDAFSNLDLGRKISDIVENKPCRDGDYGEPTADQFLIPCIELRRWVYQPVEMFYKTKNTRNPIAFSDLIHAAAVDQNCDWCPNFKASDAKKLDPASDSNR